MYIFNWSCMEQRDTNEHLRVHEGGPYSVVDETGADLCSNRLHCTVAPALVRRTLIARCRDHSFVARCSVHA